MPTAPVLKDARYSIALEYCGYARRRWVVRFCHSWIGTGRNRADAEYIATCHNALRIKASEAPPILSRPADHVAAAAFMASGQGVS